MPRTYTAPELSRLGGDYNVATRAEVKDAGGTWRELTNYAGTGRNYFESARWSRSIDQPVMTGTVSFLREVLGWSVAPLITASPINQVAAAYSALLAGGRAIRLTTAATALGVAPVAGDWKEMFLGRIDDPAWGGDDGTATVTISDPGAWLLETNIEAERVYSDAVGQPLETVIQQILADNPSAPLTALLGGAVTLYTPVSPGWNIKQFTQAKVNVFEAIRALAQQIGWDVRFQYDAANVLRLTLFQPPRGKTVADYTIAVSGYYELPQLDQAEADIRTKIAGSYVDAATGARLTRFVQSDAAHTDQFGIRYMEVNEAATSNIDSATEMDLMLTAIKSDLQDPVATHVLVAPYFWIAELGDLASHAANSVHYDVAQLLAVVSIEHTLSATGESTALTTRGKVAGSYKAWLALQSDGTVDATPVVLKNFRWADAETTRTYAWTRGDRVTSVWVYDRLVAVGGGDGWPVAGDLPTAVLLAGFDSYVAQKPPAGFQRYVQVEPRSAVAESGDVRRAIVDPAPSALAGKIRATRTNGIADLAIEIAGVASNWPVTAQLYEDDPNGAAIYTAIVTTPQTIDKLSTGAAVLGARALPLRELRRWYLKLTDVGGEVAWAFSSADRDPLPSGSATASDYRPAPSLAISYDTDTDTIRVTVPGGKTKTYAVAGGGVATYTVGDLLDDATVENALARGVTTADYLVEVQGGGVWVTVWKGPLHGATAAGPSLEVTQTRGPTSDSLAYVAPLGTVELSINGGAFSTAPASPIVVSRPGAGAASLTYTFRLSLNGQVVTESVDVLAIDADTNTVTPDLSAPQSVPTTTTTAFTPVTSNPSGGAAPSLFVTLRGTTGTGSVSGAIADGVEKAITSGEVITANRPAFGTTVQASADFRSVIGAGGTARIVRTILNQVKTTFGPSLDVVATPGPTSYSIAYAASGAVELSISGAAYSAAPASPIVVTRPAAGAAALEYTFRIIADGQTVTNLVTVQPIDADTNTVTPDLVVTAAVPAATTQDWTYSASNPSGGAAPTVTVRLRGTTGTHSIIGALADGTEYTISGGTTTVNRPAFGTTTNASIEFKAIIAGGGVERIQRTVLNQVKTSFGPSLVVTPTPSSGSYSLAYSGTWDTLLLSIDGGTYSAPAASPIVVTRTSSDHVYSFKATRDGTDVVQSITVPALASSAPTGMTAGSVTLDTAASNEVLVTFTPVGPTPDHYTIKRWNRAVDTGWVVVFASTLGNSFHDNLFTAYGYDLLTSGGIGALEIDYRIEAWNASAQQIAEFEFGTHGVIRYTV